MKLKLYKIDSHITPFTRVISLQGARRAKGSIFMQNSVKIIYISFPHSLFNMLMI